MKVHRKEKQDGMKVLNCEISTRFCLIKTPKLSPHILEDLSLYICIFFSCLIISFKAFHIGTCVVVHYSR